MELHEAIAKRYSVRAYRNDAVDEATLGRVLEAACLAPTACNLQPFRLIVLRTPGREADVDATIAMDHLILAATAEGLGTCWVAAFDPVAARDVLGLSDSADLIAFTPLGYPADSPRPRQRRPLAELVYRERWGN